MLNLLPQDQSVSRRGCLQIGGLVGLGVYLSDALRQRAVAAAEGTPSRDVNCILIWTRGGTSHHDTFDPKPAAPLSVRGEFQTIDAATPGVRFAEVVPSMAKHQQRFALLRGWNPQNGSHGTADQWVRSGRRFNQAIAYPCYGAVMSYRKGVKTAILGSSNFL